MGIGSGTNLYMYSRCNPVIQVDPSGRAGEPPQLHLIQQSGGASPSQRRQQLRDLGRTCVLHIKIGELNGDGKAQMSAIRKTNPFH